jgi:hypothetical protein
LLLLVLHHRQEDLAEWFVLRLYHCVAQFLTTLSLPLRAGSFNWSRQAVVGNAENLVIHKGGPIIGTSALLHLPSNLPHTKAALSLCVLSGPHRSL